MFCRKAAANLSLILPTAIQQYPTDTQYTKIQKQPVVSDRKGNRERRGKNSNETLAVKVKAVIFGTKTF